MRAYHRVDPLMDERKSHYTPAQFGAFLKVQLLAGRQTRRGSFRSMTALRGALPVAYVRQIDHLLTEGDLVVRDDGAVYVDGWDEWQEGDLTVGDRMARLRNRHRNATVTGSVTLTVTEPSPAAIRSSVGVGVGISGSDEPENARDSEPEFPVLQWLNAHGCYVRPGNGYHQKLVTACERHDPDELLATLDRLSAAGVPNGDVKGLLFGAIDQLDASKRPILPSLQSVDAAERAEVRNRRVNEDIWKRREEQYRFTGAWDESWGPTPEVAPA